MLLEGHPGDLADELGRNDLRPSGAPQMPVGAHRGRISVRPGEVAAVGRRLAAISGVAWLAEAGIGTIHVATGEPAALAACRDGAHVSGGWLLREAGAPDLDGFGTASAAGALAERVRRAFDPAGKLAPGRLPRPQPEVEGEAEGEGSSSAVAAP